jgi:hypothetical protein
MPHASVRCPQTLELIDPAVVLRLTLTEPQPVRVHVRAHLRDKVAQVVQLALTDAQQGQQGGASMQL